MPDTTPTPTRRSVITSTGALALAAIAGCTTSTASDAGDDPSPTDASADSTPTPVDADDHHEEDNTHHGETSHEDEHGHEHGGLPSEPADSVTVAMRTTDGGYHFDPHVVWVEPGGTVTFELESGIHTATAYAPANDKPQRIPAEASSFASGTVSEPGATFEHTFEVEGVYDYYCAPHETVGMIGSVLVGEPDPHDQPGLSEPGADLPERCRAKIADLNEQVNGMLGHTHGEETSAPTGESDGDDHGDESGHEEGGHDDGGHDEGGHDTSGHEEGGHHEGDEETGHDDGHVDHNHALGR